MYETGPAHCAVPAAQERPTEQVEVAPLEAETMPANVGGRVQMPEAVAWTQVVCGDSQTPVVSVPAIL